MAITAYEKATIVEQARRGFSRLFNTLVQQLIHILLRPIHRLNAIAHTDLFKQVIDVGFYCVHADAQRCRNLSIRSTGSG
jgi:hypothetical protein